MGSSSSRPRPQQPMQPPQQQNYPPFQQVCVRVGAEQCGGGGERGLAPDQMAPAPTSLCFVCSSHASLNNTGSSQTHATLQNPYAPPTHFTGYNNGQFYGGLTPPMAPPPPPHFPQQSPYVRAAFCVFCACY